VLTAGHVVDGEKYPNGFFLGLTELGLSVSVSDIIIHPDLDIALIGLETESADQGLVRFSIESTALTGKRVDFYGVNRLSNAREAQKNHTVGSWHPELGGYLCDHRILRGFSGGIAVVGGVAIGVITQRHETEQQTLVVPLHRADPAYALFTNEQLATMVQMRPDSKEALGDIPGVGPQRVEKYGDVFIALLLELTRETPPQAGKPAKS
jgi:hypothetical protein